MKEKIFDNGEYLIVDIADSQPTRENVYAEIEQYKAQLASTDYQCLKYAEGELTEDEYSPIRELRKQLRKQINELEDRLEQDV